MRIKNLLFVAFAAFFCFSCKKEEVLVEPVCEEFDLSLAEELFSKALSCALYEHESLRDFIKSEALKEFDNDYDVFWPYVRNSVVEEGKTFRELILSYVDEPTLVGIEHSIPKLTILVPDWSWVDTNCFSVRSWDTSDPCVGVGFEDNLSDHLVYGNGAVVQTVSRGVIPSFPVVLVKDNERMKITSANTKSGDLSFDYADPAFRNIKTKYDVYDYDYILSNSDYTEYGDWVEDRFLSDVSISAWNEFGQRWGNAAQRDYIYYGMTKSLSSGLLDRFMRERLLRFRIDPHEALGIMSMPDDDDPEFREDDIVRYKNSNKLDEENMELGAWDWTSGRFEIRIAITTSCENREVSLFEQTFSLAPSDLFKLSKVHIVNEQGTWFHTAKWQYSYNVNDLQSVWYYPSGTLLLNAAWDLSTTSYQFLIDVYEMDADASSTYTETNGFKHTSSLMFSEGAGVDLGVDPVKIKINYNRSITDAYETTCSYSKSVVRAIKTQRLGKAVLDYCENVIAGESSKQVNGVTKHGYDIHSTKVGPVYFSFVPQDIRD